MATIPFPTPRKPDGANHGGLESIAWSRQLGSLGDRGRLQFFFPPVLFQRVKTDEQLLPEGDPIDLLATEKWKIGGTNQVFSDYFDGKVDDLRFYGSDLNDTEVLAIYQDDIGGAAQAGYHQQILYDEGTSTSGLSISLDDGVLRKDRRGSGERRID